MAAAVGVLCLVVPAAAQSERPPSSPVPARIPIAEAIRDSNGDTIPDRQGKRVHVQGVVTIGSGVIADDRLQVYFQDETAGIYLFSMSRGDDIPAGSLIDVVGLLGQYRGAIQITRPEITIIGQRPLPPPIESTVAEAASWKMYGRRVTVSGKLGEPVAQGPYIAYDLSSGGNSIQLLMPPGVSREFAVGSILLGSEVSVTGVVTIYATAPPYRSGFQLLVASPTAIRLIARPLPAWLTRGTIGVIAVMLAAAAAAWLARLLRRRMTRRRRQATTLNALAAMAAGAGDGESFLLDALQLMTRNGIIDGAVIHLLEERKLRLRSSHGIENGKARLLDEEIQNRIGRNLGGGDLAMNKPLTFSGDESLLYPLICVPLQGRTRTVGVLTGFTRTRHALTPAEAGVIASCANLIALGVENVQILEENEQKRRDLEQLAVCDSLTGLYNRHFMDEYLRIHMAMARRQNAPISFIAIDLDHFKQVNDRFGHAIGDQVLSAVGQLIRNTVRASDLPVRLGGEEFMVVMPGASEAGALTFATRLQHALHEQRFPEVDESLRVSSSIGIAVYPDHGDSVPGLMRVADAALYDSKHAGRDRITIAGTEPLMLGELL